MTVGLIAIAGAISLGLRASAAEVLAPPRPAELKQAVDVWLAQRRLENSPVIDAIKPLWQLDESASTEQMFDALMQTFYYVDDDARKLVDACRTLTYSPEILSPVMSGTHRNEPLFTNNLRLFYGRHLAVLTLYEEALAVFAQVDVSQVVDPASYLFYRGVCEHHLLMRKEGVVTLERLLNDTESVPVRFRELGELMKTDLQNVEEKSLGEVARQMRDVERRLLLGRAGEGVQGVEDRIIATLDELIKKLEDQQSQSSSSSGSSSGGPATNPAEQSYIGGVRGAGLTDRKDIGHKDHWGDLPPKAQAAAKNMLDRQFPAHYRQAVEEYLKKLAQRPAPKQ